eukprot:Rmarinus@m.11288
MIKRPGEEGTESVDTRIEGNGSITRIYSLLWHKFRDTGGPPTPLTGKSCANIRIPDTVIYQDGKAVEWYFTAKDGQIKKKHSMNVTPENIWLRFCIDMRAHEKKAYQSSLIIAVFYHTCMDAPDDMGVTSQYMDKQGLNDFLMSVEDTGWDGALQMFVSPLGRKNDTIKVAWTPQVCVIERRVNHRTLDDRRCPPSVRCTTYDGSSNNVDTHAVVGVLLSNLLGRCTEGIVRHVRNISLDRTRISSMTVYFKIDVHSRLWFLWCGGCKLERDQKQRLDKSLTLSGKAALERRMTTAVVAPPVNAVVSSSDSKADASKNDETAEGRNQEKARLAKQKHHGTGIKVPHMCLSCSRLFSTFMQNRVPYQSVLEHYALIRYVHAHEGVRALLDKKGIPQVQSQEAGSPPVAPGSDGDGAQGKGEHGTLDDLATLTSVDPIKAGSAMDTTVLSEPVSENSAGASTANATAPAAMPTGETTSDALLPVPDSPGGPSGGGTCEHGSEGVGGGDDSEDGKSEGVVHEKYPVAVAIGQGDESGEREDVGGGNHVAGAVDSGESEASLVSAPPREGLSRTPTGLSEAGRSIARTDTAHSTIPSCAGVSRSSSSSTNQTSPGQAPADEDAKATGEAGDKKGSHQAYWGNPNALQAEDGTLLINFGTKVEQLGGLNMQHPKVKAKQAKLAGLRFTGSHDPLRRLETDDRLSVKDPEMMIEDEAALRAEREKHENEEVERIIHEELSSVKREAILDDADYASLDNQGLPMGWPPDLTTIPIPPPLRRHCPSLSERKYLKLSTRKDFLKRSLPVCNDCYHKYEESQARISRLNVHINHTNASSITSSIRKQLYEEAQRAAAMSSTRPEKKKKLKPSRAKPRRHSARSFDSDEEDILSSESSLADLGPDKVRARSGQACATGCAPAAERTASQRKPRELSKARPLSAKHLPRERMRVTRPASAHVPGRGAKAAGAGHLSDSSSFTPLTEGEEDFCDDTDTQAWEGDEVESAAEGGGRKDAREGKEKSDMDWVPSPRTPRGPVRRRIHSAPPRQDSGKNGAPHVRIRERTRAWSGRPIAGRGGSLHPKHGKEKSQHVVELQVEVERLRQEHARMQRRARYRERKLLQENSELHGSVKELRSHLDYVHGQLHEGILSRSLDHDPTSSHARPSDPSQQTQSLGASHAAYSEADSRVDFRRPSGGRGRNRGENEGLRGHRGDGDSKGDSEEVLCNITVRPVSTPAWLKDPDSDDEYGDGVEHGAHVRTTVGANRGAEKPVPRVPRKKPGYTSRLSAVGRRSSERRGRPRRKAPTRPKAQRTAPPQDQPSVRSSAKHMLSPADDNRSLGPIPSAVSQGTEGNDVTRANSNVVGDGRAPAYPSSRRRSSVATAASSRAGSDAPGLLGSGTFHVRSESPGTDWEAKLHEVLDS